ncbi:MAG: sulfur carrier protein ThiS [Thermodesulfobacteriota bacterium]
MVSSREVLSLKLTLNGFPEEFESEAVTIQELLDTAQENDPAVIVEVNGRFVYRKDFASVALCDGDTVELIHPSFGG